MTAENVYNIAIHLSQEELEKLYMILSKKVYQNKPTKRKKDPIITSEEAIEYLLKNVFSKK